MLILTRHLDDAVVINVAGVEVVVRLIGIERNRAVLGFDAPMSVKILREELLPVKERKRA